MMPDRLADDFRDIRARAESIKAWERPRCPVNTGRLLHDCLRSATPCPKDCPYVNDWIGPKEEI